MVSDAHKINFFEVDDSPFYCKGCIMKSIKDILHPKTSLGMYESYKFSKNGMNDARDDCFQEVFIEMKSADDEVPSGKKIIATRGVTFHISPFVVRLVGGEFVASREVFFNAYKMTLDCRNLDKDFVDCSHASGNCVKKSCDKRAVPFSKAISTVNNAIENIVGLLSLVDIDKAQKRKSLKKKVDMLGMDAQHEHKRVQLESELYTVIQELLAEEVENYMRVITLLNTKIRIIDEIEKFIRAYFRSYMLKLQCYWGGAKKTPKLPMFKRTHADGDMQSKTKSYTMFAEEDLLLEACGCTLLGVYGSERENAISRRDGYLKKIDDLRKEIDGDARPSDS